MEIIACTLLDDVAPFAGMWNDLASGVPFRSWAWNSSWWRHYGLPSPHRKLCILIALENNQIVGIVPWFVERSAARGTVVRWLGSDEIHSDYLGAMCRNGYEESVAQAAADFLLDRKNRVAWDQLEIDGIDASDPCTSLLIAKLTQGGCTAHPTYPLNCWRLSLPASWEEYLAMVSKGHRKRLRRIDRDLFATGRAQFHIVKKRHEIDSIWSTFIELHQKRRNMKGDEGCFISPRFEAFHREMMERLFDDGNLQFSWLELDGRRAAADYQIVSAGVTYVYQAGIDIDLLAEEPGNVMTAATIKHAIATGGSAVDFLRGDEPYKPHFRAEARPCPIMRVVPNRPVARLRHNMLVVGRRAKEWLTAGTKERSGRAHSSPLPVVSEQPEE